MDEQSLSQRQRDILAFVSRFSDEHGYPPTVREIGAAINITSTSVVDYNLNKLTKCCIRQMTKSRGSAPLVRMALGIPEISGDLNGLSNLLSIEKTTSHER